MPSRKYTESKIEEIGKGVTGKSVAMWSILNRPIFSSEPTLFINIFDLGLERGDQVAREASRLGMRLPELFRAGRNEDYVSKNFERWKELATLTSKEEDPAKLTELANEMNLVLNQKTPYLDPPLHAPSPGSHEERQLDDVLKANAGDKVCFT